MDLTTDILESLAYLRSHIDYRSPEEVAEDNAWITKTTQAIIDRRKARQERNEQRS